MNANAPIGEDDLQAYIDGRLEAGRAAFVAAWLEEHADVAARVAAERSQRDALRAELQSRHDQPVPARLRLANVQALRRRRWRRAALRIAASLLLLAAGSAAGWTLRGLLAPGSTVPPLSADALAAHRIFSVEVRHPVEVDATQEAHLVQWLSRRLGRELVAPNLAGLGYRLIGGRLLSAETGPAAQLMYESGNGQRLTLYLRTGEGSGRTAFRYIDEGGIGAFYWLDDGCGYAVSGAADRQSLLRVAELVYEQTGAAAHR
jgi:anti-sigma factor RsiW